jgi:hypothetical protein
VISPLLSNIYLHVLDSVWTKRCAQLGTLVRYADDFVVVCHTAKACEEAESRVRHVLNRLGLELHPDKTRRVDLSWGKEGFDFLGCHLRKRLSGAIWEKQRKRVYFLQRWPSQRSMKRVRQRVKELTGRHRSGAKDVRDIIADLNPDSLEVLTGCKLEPELAAANTGDPVQFERQGYFCRDPDSTPGDLVFNRTVGLRDTWARVSGGKGA